MPTIITHAIVGASLGMLTPNNVPIRRLVIVLFLLPIVPDLDVIGFRLGISYADPLGHRGFTHSILFAVLAAVVVKYVLFRPIPALSKSGLTILALCFIATLSHGILDAFTDAGHGVGFFIPFDDGRYFFPWRPIDTSPLSISSFLSERGLSILANELRWVGIPLLAFTALILVGKRLLRRNA